MGNTRSRGQYKVAWAIQGHVGQVKVTWARSRGERPVLDLCKGRLELLALLRDSLLVVLYPVLVLRILYRVAHSVLEFY